MGASKIGDVAQLVEHPLCKRRVSGSNPLISTIFCWAMKIERAIDLFLKKMGSKIKNFL